MAEQTNMSNIQTRLITEAIVNAWEADRPAREIVNGAWSKEGKLAGQKHGLIAMALIMKLAPYVKANDLGQVYADGLNYVLDGERGNIRTMRIPDLSFVVKARVDLSEEGFYYLAPDLAVEIVSPSETDKIINEKVSDYLTHGTQQVWVIHPENQTLTVHQPNSEPRQYQKTDTLNGGDLLPDFALSISELFN